LRSEINFANGQNPLRLFILSVVVILIKGYLGQRQVVMALMNLGYRRATEIFTK